jgi:uncharacterized protein
MSFQPLPVVTEDTAAFWEGGAAGVLNIHRCSICALRFHPPAPVCPACLSVDVGPRPVSGRATVQGFTVNTQPWSPDMVVPYVVGIVSLDDAPGVQLTTRFVDVEPQQMAVGMSVEVVFAPADDVWLPLFKPTSAP